MSEQFIEQWLAEYKFKDWTTTETSNIEVTDAKRMERTKEIGQMLIDHNRWGTHGRGIPMATLRSELNLRIDDYEEIPELYRAVSDYFGLVKGYRVLSGNPVLVHSREFL